MIDRVDANDRIESALIKRERLACVRLAKGRSVLQSSLARAPVCVRDRLVVQLDPDNLASRQPD